jgi:uncharacterized damage-inducible protein DinB
VTNELLDLVAYNDWANGRLAAALAGLDESSLSTPILSSFGSLRETLAHIVSAEWIWLRRWEGESPQATPSWVAEDSTASLLDRLARVRADRQAFLASIGPGGLARTVEYRNLAGQSYRNTLADLIRHVVNHSTYHRGQAATQLRQLNLVPPSTDFVVYLREPGVR